MFSIDPLSFRYEMYRSNVATFAPQYSSIAFAPPLTASTFPSTSIVPASLRRTFLLPTSKCLRCYQRRMPCIPIQSGGNQNGSRGRPICQECFERREICAELTRNIQIRLDSSCNWCYGQRLDGEECGPFPPCLRCIRSRRSKDCRLPYSGRPP